MARATIDGCTVAYEVYGSGRPWVITPGGRFSKDAPGVRELAQALADAGQQALVWDRPNTGESDVCFTGESESAVQADVLAGLLTHLGTGPTVLAGGSGGSRVALLTAARHPEVAAGLALWWVTGGIFGLLSLATHYCGGSLKAAWADGMAAVAALPEWGEAIARNPANRDRILGQDRDAFVATMERWMAAYLPRDDEPVPGLTQAGAAALDVPTLVFRSGESDVYHTRATSERLAAALPQARLVEPPWGDREWIERQAARSGADGAGLFARWPLLAPTLLDWAHDTLP
jgi:pimeloyl-ACP methyl ester carboxylesterase